jgi:hypothetical protein
MKKIPPVVTANELRESVGIKKRPPVMKAAAVVTIRNAHKMDEEGRKAIAAWLRRHANYIVKHGKAYGPEMRGRYLYVDR